MIFFPGPSIKDEKGRKIADSKSYRYFTYFYIKLSNEKIPEYSIVGAVSSYFFM